MKPDESLLREGIFLLEINFKVKLIKCEAVFFYKKDIFNLLGNFLLHKANKKRRGSEQQSGHKRRTTEKRR